jgi:hypothetical protein
VVYNPSLHGGSAYFDGTGDFLTTPDSSTVADFRNLPFTVEFWMYSTDAASVIIRQNAAGTPNWAILITSGSIYWQNGYEVSSLYYIALASLTTNPLRNAWTHIAITRNGSNELKFWINGVGQSSVVTDSTNYNSTNGVVVGSGSYGLLTGYLSDVRITKGVAVYTTTFTPPTQTLGNYSATYPASLLLNFTNGGIIDQHSTNVLETVGNAQLSTAVKKYGNASMYFDGTGDYLYGPSSPQNIMGTGNFTVELWIYPTNVTGTFNIFTVGSESAGRYGMYILNGAILTNMYGLSSVTFNSGITINTWSHIAITRSGSTIRGFLNGVLSGTTETNSASIGNGPIYVGAANDGTGAFVGYMDDFRITKGVARYTTTFTPPTTALIAR